MRIIKLKNANGSVVAVTSTATALTALLTTAVGENQPLPDGLDAVLLNPEDGDVRMLADGNTPTTTKGLLLKQGGFYKFVGINVTQIKLIRTGGSNVAVGVQVGFSDQNESTFASGTGSSSSGGALQSAGADAESNTASAQYTSSRIQGYNGTTWDRIRAGISGAVSAVTGYINNLPFAQYVSSAVTLTANQFTNLYTTINGFLKASLGDLISGEDPDNNRMMVEHQYSYSRKTADGQVKASAGFLHTVTFSATGTVTAGVITIYDNTAESGTVIWSGTIQVGLNPTTITLDVLCLTGIYIGYDGTIANVATTASFR